MSNLPRGSNIGLISSDISGVYDIAMPFDPNTLQSNSMRMGLSQRDAMLFTQVAMNQFRDIQSSQPNKPINSKQMTDTIGAYNESLRNRIAISEEMLQSSGATITDDMGDHSANVEDDEEDSAKEEMISVETIVVHGQERKKYKFSQEALDEWFGGEDPYAEKKEVNVKRKQEEPRRDIITALCANIELAVELGKHLRPKDVISLYSANRAFHDAVKGHLLSSVRMWISYNAPEAGKIFNFRYYKKHLTEDPMGRTYGQMCEGLPESLQPPERKRDEVRTIPGLKYLQLVVGRDRFCHDIIAIMARNGHRMPPTMHSTLLRLWLFMDVATTSHRQAMMHSTAWWRDIDLYNAQLFFVKLAMHFNDPIFGPSSLDLMQLMMGQQGLYPLWQLLAGKNYTTLRDIIRLKAHYDLEFPMERWNSFNESFYGCTYEDLGTKHCEGWGKGHRHLVRADELVPQEAIRRGLQLERHMRYMVLWGHIDWKTGENLVPTEEELYIEDEEDVTETMDTTYHWKRKHAMKKRWATLTEEERQEIIDEEEDDRLRALAFIEDSDDSDSDNYSITSSELAECLDPDNDDAMSAVSSTGSRILPSQDVNHECTRIDVTNASELYDLEEEINRGYILPPQPKDGGSRVPAIDDKEGWTNFVDEAIMDMELPVEVDEDYALRAQAWQAFDDEYDEPEEPWEQLLRSDGTSWRMDMSAING